MALNPVGPLPASTYWRRRAVLLVGVIVVLVLLKACSGDGAKGKTSSTATPKPTVTASVGPTPARTTAPPVSNGPVCADTALTLTATTDADTYSLGATPKITLRVKNAGAAACRRDLGAGAVELLVYSGKDRFWSSDDCNPSTATSVVTLAPGGTQAVVKTWPGRRSLPSCAGSKDAAAVGTYKVVARVGSLRQDGAVFRLHA